MKQTLIVFSCSLIINISFAQHLYPEKFDNCHLTQFCLDCGEPKAQTPHDFAKYLVQKLNPKSLKRINGSIDVQILVDTLGNSCLLSVKNESNAKTSKLNIQGAIQNSSKWITAISQGKPTSSSVSLKLSFIEGYLSIERI